MQSVLNFISMYTILDSESVTHSKDFWRRGLYTFVCGLLLSMDPWYLEKKNGHFNVPPSECHIILKCVQSVLNYAIRMQLFRTLSVTHSKDFWRHVDCVL